MIFGAIALLLLAFALVAAELFVPSHGILALIAVCVACASVWMAYSVMPVLGILFGVVLLIATPVVFFAAIKVYPNTAVGKRVLLKTPPPTSQGFDNEIARLESFIGRQGIAQSALRPAGTVEVDGERLDALSESDMIPAGSPVEIIKLNGLKVIVRPLLQG